MIERDTVSQGAAGAGIQSVANLPELAIVIPVHNESGAILPLLAEIQGCLQASLDYEVVVVDDASEDGTLEELRNAQSLLPSLHVLVHGQRRGQSAALATGVQAAGAPWVVTMDGDGQNDPKDILVLWQQRLQDPEVGMICGLRASRRDSPTKRIASKIANGVRRWLLQDGISDTGCGLKLFQRRLFIALPAFDHMHRFLPALVQAQGSKVTTVAVNHRPRLTGRSKYGVGGRLAEGLIDLAGVWWLKHRSLAGGKPFSLKEDPA